MYSTVRTISMLNVEAMRTLAQHLVGTHDMSSFRMELGVRRYTTLSSVSSNEQ